MSNRDTPREAPLEREALIARAAYLRAEKRGFQGGDPVADWLEAEAEVDSWMARRAASADTEPKAPPGRERELVKAGAQAREAPPEAPEGRAAQPAAQAHTPAADSGSVETRRGTDDDRRTDARRTDARRSEERQPAEQMQPPENDRRGLAAQLEANSQRLEKLRPRLAELKSGTRKEVDRELQRLDSIRDRLARKADDVRRKGEKKRGDWKQQAEKLLRDFKAGLERLGSRFDR